jgi:hypothetical protein
MADRLRTRTNRRPRARKGVDKLVSLKGGSRGDNERTARSSDERDWLYVLHYLHRFRCDHWGVGTNCPKFRPHKGVARTDSLWPGGSLSSKYQILCRLQVVFWLVD